MKFKNKSLPYSVLLLGMMVVLTNNCKKPDPTPPAAHETGSVTDIDHNAYKTIRIGNQWWMAENLKVKKYRSGDPIPQVQSEASWKDSLSGAYCIYDNNPAAPGLLYNWYAVNDGRNIAPAGWHVPGDEEWKELEKFLGMSQADADNVNWRGTHEGEKLKQEAPNGWTNYDNVWATNESGFTALAGGCRLFNGTWGDPGLFATGFWWSSTSNSANNQAWYRYLDYKNANVFRFYGSKNYGFSVRCVKD